MWPWLKRWRDWAMNDLLPRCRLTPQPQALHHSYEKAGLTLHDQPIPWNAEAVLVEALVRLPSQSTRIKTDFTLHLPNQIPYPAEQLCRQESGERFRVCFRLPPPAVTTRADIYFRQSLLGHLSLPILSREDFLKGLRLEMPTLFVRVGQESVACQTFVTTQCRGLMASAVLLSPTSLAPLLDMDLQIEFRCDRSGTSFRVPARLCSSQLAGRRAVVTIAPTRYPRRLGTWTATWYLGNRPLAMQRVRGISKAAFLRSLRISDTRFMLQEDSGRIRLTRQVTPNRTGRIGPCFLVASNEPGMAAVCSLRIVAQVAGAMTPPLLLEQEMLITDGPTPVAPGTLDSGDLAQVSGFELSAGKRILGTLSMSPAPVATFTSEGGFKPPHEFTWSAAAEEEMVERLNRLFDQNPGKRN